MMNKRYQQILRQISEMARDGTFGDEAQQQSKNYVNIQDGIPTLLYFLNDFYEQTLNEDELIADARLIFLQGLVVLYRESQRANPEIAQAYIASLLMDYPGTHASALLNQWNALAHASLGFKSIARSENALILWDQSQKLFQAYNEFLNGLLPFLIISWNCIRKNEIELNIFKMSYALKAKKFSEITQGENGPFYLFHRIMKPRIRNAIAHSSISYDREHSAIHYVNGVKQKTEYEISLIEFMGLVTLGSHLGTAYIAALSAGIVWEVGTDKEKQSLPPHLFKFLNFNPGSI